ncbi:MAG: hypothetical protein R2856_32290 [Caldilineaceae bacterium]
MRTASSVTSRAATTPNPRHNLERCEVMGTEGRFVLDNLYQELTSTPRRSDELTVIRNSIMGGLSGFSATFTNRIHRWLEQIHAEVELSEIEAWGPRTGGAGDHRSRDSVA